MNEGIGDRNSFWSIHSARASLRATSLLRSFCVKHGSNRLHPPLVNDRHPTAAGVILGDDKMQEGPGRRAPGLQRFHARAGEGSLG